MSEENKNVTPSEEDLSKAIDGLIEEHFGPKVETTDLSKGNGQPENKMDQLPKDTDVDANGGKDVIKAKDTKEDDEEEEEETEKAKKAKAEKCKKSEDGSSEFEELKKAFESEKKEKEELSKSFTKLSESHSALEKSVSVLTDKINSAGEIFKGLKYEIDLLKKTPMPRQSIKNVDEIKKSFHDPEAGEAQGQKFQKSEVEGAIESLVKAGKISSVVGTEFEMYGKIQNPQASQLVAQEVLKNRK